MNKIVSMDEMIPLIEEKLKEDGKVVFTPKGTSMLPTIVGEVDTVSLVKPEFPLAKYSIPLYKRDSGGYVLHRVIGRKNGCYTMRGDNQYVKEKGIREDQIIGVVRTYTHNGEVYEAYGPQNKTYAKKRHRKIGRRKIYLAIRRRLGKVKRKILRKDETV